MYDTRQCRRAVGRELSRGRGGREGKGGNERKDGRSSRDREEELGWGGERKTGDRKGHSLLMGQASPRPGRGRTTSAQVVIIGEKAVSYFL
jgi:hypothetical protein